MRKVKATPMGMSFTKFNDTKAAKLSDVGNYRVRIEPVSDQHGMIVRGDICYGHQAENGKNGYAQAILDLVCEPKLGGEVSRYYVSEDKRYSYHYTKKGISQLLSDITGEPCEIEIVERSK